MKNTTTTTTEMNRKEIVAQMREMGMEVRTKDSTKQLNGKLQMRLAEIAQELEAEKQRAAEREAKKAATAAAQQQHIEILEKKERKQVERVEVTEEMREVMAATSTKAHKIRTLYSMGVPVVQIAELLDIANSHAYNMVHKRNYIKTVVLQVAEWPVRVSYIGPEWSEETVADYTHYLHKIACLQGWTEMPSSELAGLFNNLARNKNVKAAKVC